MKTVILFLLFASLSLQNTYAYSNFTIPSDSLTATTEKPSKTTFIPKKIGEKGWRAMLSLDIKRAILTDWNINTYGLRTGYEYNGVSTINIGLYTLTSANNLIPKIEIFNPIDTTFTQNSYKGAYLALYYERILLHSNKFNIAIPTYIKYGRLKTYMYQSNTDIRLQTNQENFTGIASGLQFQYYILPWFGPKFNIGYRYTINQESTTANIYDSFYIGISARVKWDQFFSHYFPNKYGKSNQNILTNSNSNR